MYKTLSVLVFMGSLAAADTGFLNAQTGSVSVLYSEGENAFFKRCFPPITPPITRECASKENVAQFSLKTYLEELPYKTGNYEKSEKGLAFARGVLKEAENSQAPEKTLENLKTIIRYIEAILTVKKNLEASQENLTYMEHQGMYSVLMSPIGKLAQKVTSEEILADPKLKGNIVERLEVLYDNGTAPSFNDLSLVTMQRGFTANDSTLKVQEISVVNKRTDAFYSAIFDFDPSHTFQNLVEEVNSPPLIDYETELSSLNTNTGTVKTYYPSGHIVVMKDVTLKCRSRRNFRTAILTNGKPIVVGYQYNSGDCAEGYDFHFAVYWGGF